MKKFNKGLSIVVAILCASFASLAQDSKGFSFQGIARDAAGSVYVSQYVKITTSILNNITPIYVEDQTTTTDAYGVFSIVIGSSSATAKTGVFANIDFSVSLNVKVEISIGTGPATTLVNYALQAVPYAKYANKSEKADSAKYANNGSPVGTMMAFAGPKSKIPNGWLYCGGQAVDRLVYKELYAVIGTSWGSGDGSKTFNVPYTQGQFLRGVSDGSGQDPDANSRLAIAIGGNSGDAVGTKEADMFKSHTHTQVRGFEYGDNYSAHDINNRAYIGPERETNATGGNETRPKNVAVYYIIKY